MVERTPAPALLLAVLLLPLGGCLGGGAGGGDAGQAIMATLPDDPATQPVHLTTPLSAASYAWSVDGVPLGTGRDASWTPGVHNHTATVRLLTTGPDGAHEKTLVLGSGTDRPAAGTAAASSAWLVPGEALHLHATGTDPDRDPVTVRWSCARLADLGPRTGERPLATEPPRGHDALATVDPARPTPAGPEGPCAAGATGPAWTVTGLQPGFYLLAARVHDGAGQGTSIAHHLYVTEDRPEPNATWRFAGTLAAGRQTLGPAAAGNEDQYQADHLFRPALPTSRTTYALTLDGEATACVSFPDESVETPCGASGSIDGTHFLGAEERVRVQLEQGVRVAYDLRLDLAYDMDPTWLYEPVA